MTVGGSHVVDFETAEHLSVLEYAALISQERIVRFLLDRTSWQSPVLRFNHARSIYLAALLNHHTIVSHLLKDPSWFKCSDSAVWYRSLSAAVVNGHVETVKVLLAEFPCVQGQLLLDSYVEILKQKISIRRRETLQILLDFLETSPYFLALNGKSIGLALELAKLN